TPSRSNGPIQPSRISPLGDSSAADGVPCTPNASHDTNVSSQYIGKLRVPVDATNSTASATVFCVPSPITLTSSPCCRANCSISGPSARQIGQNCAQIQMSTG